MTTINFIKAAKISLVVISLLATTACTCNRKNGQIRPSYNNDTALNNELQQYNNATVNFAFDRSDLNKTARTTLDNVSEVMSKHVRANYTIEGHCDERGTEEYNIALGERRANAAKKYIDSKNNGATNVNVVSYGKSQPIAMGHTETDYAMNRRATVKASD